MTNYIYYLCLVLSMEEEQFQTIMLLANHKQIENKRTLFKITEQDKYGWVLLDELLARPPFKKNYSQKTAYKIFKDPLLKKVIEIRCKANASRPNAKPLKYTEIVKGGQRNRKGSAYRLKRNQTAWRYLFVALSNNHEQLVKFQKTDYYRKRWGYDHPKMIRQFFYKLTEPLKFLDQHKFDDFLQFEGAELAETQLYPLLALYLTNEQKFEKVVKNYWEFYLTSYDNTLEEFQNSIELLEELYAEKEKREIDKKLLKRAKDDYKTQLVISALKSSSFTKWNLLLLLNKENNQRKNKKKKRLSKSGQ